MPNVKKITSLAVLVFLLFLTACGNGDNQANGGAENAPSEDLLQLPEERLPPEDNLRLSRDELLYDFDYMMQIMEDIFPYFGLVERRLGVDIRVLAGDVRDMITYYPDSFREFADEIGIALADMPPLCEHVFWSILRTELFAHIAPPGHTGILHHGLFQLLRPFYDRDVSAEDAPLDYVNRQAFRNPASRDFYEAQGIFFDELSEEHGVFFEAMFAEHPALLRVLLGIEPAPEDMPPTTPTSTMTMEILEEGRIAYLSIPSFAQPNLRNPGNALMRFYREIQDFEHLIIDIRNNGGGRTDFWRMLILYPLWVDRDAMPNMPLYAFYTDSDLGRLLGEAHIRTEAGASRYRSETEHLLSSSEIMETSSLPYLNPEDLRNLGYGIRFNTSLGNIEEGHFRREGVTVEPVPFRGQIWLLTNERNFSAASLFARHAKYMDFAILVGEPTGGGYTSTVVTSFVLPHTGVILRLDIDYLTDQYGRLLEEFPTTPHYANRPGLDALETVLQMIAYLSFYDGTSR